MSLWALHNWTIWVNCLLWLLRGPIRRWDTWSLNHSRFIRHSILLWVPNSHMVHMMFTNTTICQSNMEWYRSNIVPSSHVGTPTKFHTYTQSPAWKALALVCLSCPWLCLAWLTRTFTQVSWCNRCSCDLSCLPSSSSAGECPVVVWGVILYLNKNLANLVPSEPPAWDRLILCLNVWTALYLTHLRQDDTDLCVCVWLQLSSRSF